MRKIVGIEHRNSIEITKKNIVNGYISRGYINVEVTLRDTPGPNGELAFTVTADATKGRPTKRDTRINELLKKLDKSSRQTALKLNMSPMKFYYYSSGECLNKEKVDELIDKIKKLYSKELLNTVDEAQNLLPIGLSK